MITGFVCKLAASIYKLFIYDVVWLVHFWMLSQTSDQVVEDI